MNQEQFINEVTKLDIKLTEEQLVKLDLYYKLLVEWNKKFNLTTILKEEDVYLKHFYDSITLIPIIKKLNHKLIADLGSGAGFPGLILAIFLPDSHITCIDATAKKTVFLNEIARELNLNNVTVVNSRIEDYAKLNREKFDIVTARGLASLRILLELSIPLLKIDGYLLPMKSMAKLEIESSSNALKELNSTLEPSIKFKLPIEESHREIVIVKKNSATDLKYPRLYDQIKKKPL